MSRPESPEFGVVLDLARIEQEMRSEEAYAREGHTARTLVRQHDLRVVLIAMKAGSRIAEHVASATATIQTLRGQVRVGLPRLARQHEDRFVELQVGGLLVIDRGLEHHVDAVSDSALLVTMGWRDKDTRA